MSLRVLPAAVAACLLFLPASASAALLPGELSQLSGTAGCVNFPTPTEGCAAGTGADGANAIAASPDGKHVYATGQNNVLAYSRGSGGELTQIQCLDGDGTSPDGGACADSTALLGAYSIEVSPSGGHVYVGGTQQIAVFSRDAGTGLLTYQSCASNAGVSDEGTACAENTRALFYSYDLAFARDGRTLYVASNGNDGGGSHVHDGVAMFDVATDGNITQPDGLTGCYTDTGSALDPTAMANQCTNVRAMNQAGGVVVSPDSKHLYVQSGSNEMGEYSIDQTTGALTQIGCVNGDGNAQGASGAEPTTCTDIRGVGDYYAVISPDGKHVYAANSAQGTVTMFVRDAATGLLSQPDSPAVCLDETGDGVECNDARELDSPWNLAMSPDGRNVYVSDASSPAGGIAVFERDAATGLLTQPAGQRGCVTNDGSAATCADGRFLDQVNAFVISPDNAFLYSIGSKGPTAFSRGVPPTCANASASTPFGTPVAISLSCSDANGDALTITPGSPSSGSLSGSGASRTYTPNAGFSGADAFTFSASDGTNGSNTATASVTVAAAPPAGGGGGDTPPPAAKPALPGLSGGSATVDKKGRFRLRLSCPAGGAACRGAVRVRTAGAVSAAKKKRVLVLARKGYNVAAGKTATIRLTMGKKARRYVKRKGTVKALAVFTAAGGGGKKTLKVTLKQG